MRKIKIIKKLETGEDFNLVDGWTNKDILLIILPLRFKNWYWKPVFSKKIITWLKFQIIFPHQ